MRLALIHSPVLGPVAWQWVAHELQARDQQVVVPDLRVAAVSGDPAIAIAEAVAQAGSDVEVLVGHSGAGVVLPSIARGLGDPVVVFVDAGVPPCHGVTTAGGDFTAQLESLARDGALPPWSTWWGDAAMELLVPDPAARRSLMAEMPRVPLELYTRPIPQPDGWCHGRCGYLLLSDAYADDARRARAHDWPVIERHGTHLDLVTHPEEVTTALLDLVARVVGNRS